MKAKELKNLDELTRKKKLAELKIELVKAKAMTKKAGNSKARETKKIIARILTLNKSDKDEFKKTKQIGKTNSGQRKNT